MKYVELFAGIGGFRVGIQKAIPDAECVYVSEWNKYAAQIYEKNFSQFKERQQEAGLEGGDSTNSQIKWGFRESTLNTTGQKYIHVDTRDIRTVGADDIPDHDLLTGGFPCQSFSIAGKRGGFKDTRGTLFFEIARIAKAKRTPYLLLENVKGLLNHDSGNTFATIISALDELGYDCQWQVVNSKDFGVPQNRERVFIVGHLRGISRPKVFPFTENFELPSKPHQEFRYSNRVGKSTTPDSISSTITRSYGDMSGESTKVIVGVLKDRGEIKMKNIANNLDANYHKGLDNHGARTGVMIQQLNNPTHSSKRVYGKEGIAPTVTDHTPKILTTSFVALTERRTEEAKKLRRMGVVKDTRNLKELMPREDGLANTVTTGDVKNQTLTNGVGIRRLTPIECERLQGFPDNWTKYGINEKGETVEISDTQRYQCLGNAVTTNVVCAIMERMAQVL